MGRIKTYTNDGTVSDKDYLLGGDADNLDATKTYLLEDVRRYVFQSTYIVNSTTSTLSLSTLNSTYPNTTTILQYKVYCPNITGGGLVYTKTGTSTWVSQVITNVV